MLLNVDQLQKKLDKDEFQEDRSMAAFWVYFVEYTGIEVKQFRDTLLQYMGNVKKSVAERTCKALDADLVVTESSGTESEVQDDNNRSRNDTDDDDAYIKSIYDEEPMVEVHMTAECNIFATGKQHAEQPDFNNEGVVDQIEAHCIALELKYQNQALKLGQHGQILNETSNKAKIKRDIDEIETINIELEHSVTRLLTYNEHLNKENETLKNHYKDMYNSIKLTRAKTIEQTTSLITQNANLKAQIQEKVFAIAASKNELRKSNRNSVDTKFAKTSVLGKPVLQPLRNQSVVRQPNAFKSERPKPKFQTVEFSAFQADVEKIYDASNSKPKCTITQTRSLPVSKSSCVTIMVVSIADHSMNSNSFSNSKHFVCSTCHKCVFNANRDACITKFLKEVNSRAKTQSNKTRSSNKPVEQKSHTQKPIRQIFKGHIFSPNKTSAVYEKTSPRSDLRWKPTGRIFKTVGLRWVPTGKILASCTSKVDSEPPHGSNVDISKIHECKQTLDLSAGTSLNGQKKQRIDLSAGTSYNVKHENLRVWLLKKLISQKPVSQWIHK
ncbi:hypothetical protein Tco_0897410 [Tanacetum coccineum]